MKKEAFSMSDREYAHQLLDKVPESKIFYIVGILEGAAIPEIEEEEPDKWDLDMIDEAKKVNDGHGIPIEDLANDLGIKL